MLLEGWRKIILYPCPETRNVLNICKDDQWINIIFRGGLPTLGFIVSVNTPTFAFWMSLRVVMAIFPQNTIFLRHPVYYLHKVPPWTWSRLWAGWRYSRWASRRGSCCRWWSSSRSGGSRRTRSSRTWDELNMIIIGLGWCKSLKLTFREVWSCIITEKREGPYSGHSQDRTLQCIHPFINFCIGDRISRLLCNYTTSNFKL